MNVRTVENVWIPLADSTRLAARLWLPDGAETSPVPAVLEYLPYRKDDGTAGQDATRHPYFASNGYASVRVDIRGTGDSDGIIRDEYLEQEQEDALEVIAWIAAQPWCSGRVGMFGYSWGGFNGLQVAARRPPALGAVVTAYSTDDRYTDDCHYMGGCLLGSDMLKWATSMRAYDALPPDPRFRDDWREVWLRRLRDTPAFIEAWLSHQSRDSYWRQGSVAEDYAAITAATLVVGGWTDPYTNAVPRLLRGLTCERRGIIGPWAHVLPYAGVPGPAIGFLAECVRWFDRWLKDADTGVEDDPLLRVWIEEPVAPASFLAYRPGRWVGVDTWPAEPVGRYVLHPTAEGSLVAARPETGGEVLVDAPQQTGEAAGVWCANGLADELPVDQRDDDARSAYFDSEPLCEAVEVLGVPEVALGLSADRPLALVAVRMCEVAADGASALVSWGLLNLTHRDGHVEPCPVMPGEPMRVTVRLNDIGHRFAAGSVIRLAVSQAHWPHAWPSPEPVRLTLHLDGCGLSLPLLPPDARELDEPFGPPENRGGALNLRDGSRTRIRTRDEASGLQLIVDDSSFDTLLPSGTRYAGRGQDRWLIGEGPLDARAEALREEWLERDGWRIHVVARASLTATTTEFVVDDELIAAEDGLEVFREAKRFEIPRRGV